MSTVQQDDHGPAAESIFIIQDAQADDHVKRLMQSMANKRAEQVTVLPCEGAWIWDPYGSFARTVLFLAQKQPGPAEIWVMGASASDQTFRLAAPHEKRDLLPVTSYMLQHVFHIHPNEWFAMHPDPKRCVLNTVLLLRRHLLLPANVRVAGYVFEATAGEFIEITSGNEN